MKLKKLDYTGSIFESLESIKSRKAKFIAEQAAEKADKFLRPAKKAVGSRLGSVAKAAEEASNKSLIMEFINPKQVMDKAMGAGTKGPRSKRKA